MDFPDIKDIKKLTHHPISDFRLRIGDYRVLFDVDVVGGLNIKKYYGDEALAIFVMPPSVEELENRLRNRSTETEEKIKTRIEKAEYELGFAKDFDVVLINDDFDTACKEAEKIILNFLKK